jgi:hypothetical protein
MANPNMFGNTFQLRSYAFAAATRKIFSTEMGGSGLAVDGGYKVRSEEFAIQNLDTAAELFFSFDSTVYVQLDPGGAFSLRMATDRIYFKCGATDTSCYFQITAALKNNWKE